MIERTQSLLVALAGASLLLSTGAAADGVREINQLCVPAGCFAGDAPGFPVEITESGSYRLTSDLDLRNEPNPDALDGITIFGVESVQLDLNGHAIVGPVVCSGTPVASCTAVSASSEAIVVGNSLSVTIRNGHLRGMSRNGLLCFASGCTIRDVSASENYFNGIAIGTDAQATIERVQLTRNRLNGIDAAFFQVGQTTIRDSRATGNGANGFWTNGLIRDSQARSNNALGVRCDGCTVLNSISAENSVGFRFDLAAEPSLAGGNRALNNTTDWVGTPFVSAINLCTAAPC